VLQLNLAYVHMSNVKVHPAFKLSDQFHKMPLYTY